jgi:hypothetical protein
MTKQQKRPLLPGQRVRFIVGPLGAYTASQARFAETLTENVQKGDDGFVIGPHPMVDGWLLVASGDSCVVPVHPSHIEAV